MNDDELRGILEKYVDACMTSLEIERMISSERVYSKRFQKKMKRLFWSHRYFGKDIHIGYAVRKIALAAGIILSLVMANEVSAQVWGVGAWEMIRSLVDGGRGMRTEFHKSKKRMGDCLRQNMIYHSMCQKGINRRYWKSRIYFLDVEWQGEREGQYIRYCREKLTDGATITYDAEVDLDKVLRINGMAVKIYYDKDMMGLIWHDDIYSYTLDSFVMDEEEYNIKQKKGRDFMKKRKLLKLAVLLLALTHLEGMANRHVMAKVGDNATIQFAYTKNVYASISIDTKGNCNVVGRIVGDFQVKKVMVKVFLEKFSVNSSSWEKVKSWSDTEGGTKASLILTHKVVSKGKYRVKVTGTVYTSKGSENVSAVSAVKSF